MEGLLLKTPSQTSPTSHVYGVLYQTWPQDDGDLRLEFLSAGAEELLETTAAELNSMLTTQSLPLVGVDVVTFYDQIAESKRKHTPWSAEFGYVCPKSGTVRWFRAQDFPQRSPDGVPFFSGVLIDMTDVKRTQERYTETYQTLSSHIDNTPLGVIEWDAEFRVKRWSGQAEAIFGWNAEEVLGKQPHECHLVHVDDEERVAGVIQRLLTHVEPRNVVFNRNYHKSGQVLFCEWHNSIVVNDHGKMISVLSLVLDHTQRHRDADALARSEEQLRSALLSAGMIGWDYNLSSGTATFSQDYWGYFGLPKQEIIGEYDAYLQVMHPDDRDCVRTAIEATIQTGAELRVEYRGTRTTEDGFPRWYSGHGEFVKNTRNGSHHIIGVTTDITARKRAEFDRASLDRELQESRKRESLGMLAGGVAHDFNNILTVILGNAGLARTTLPPTLEVQSYLDTIEKACQRAAGLCRQMVAYAGVGRFSLREANLNQLIHESGPSLLTVTKPPTQLRFSMPHDLPHINADPAQIRQLLYNLIENAAESLPKTGGTIHVSTRSHHGVDPPLDHFVPKLTTGNGVILRVTDTGYGMTAEVREKMYEPFFSTKFTGRGLGLAAVHGIARSHHASLRVFSTVGTGTTIEIFFPARDNKQLVVASNANPSHTHHTETALPHWRVTGKALVVDDEDNIRVLTTALLTERGFHVESGADGVEGLALFEADPHGYHLAVVDFLMPRLNGEEMITRIRQTRTDLPIVFMTGHSDQHIQARLHSDGATTILNKPFSVEEFLSVIRQAIQRTSPPLLNP